MRDYAMGALAAIIAILFIAGIVAWGLQYDRPRTQSRGIIDHIRTIEYNNHEYLVFNRGIVHNPDCKCMKKVE